MSVKILAHTTDPEKLVASAAKLCYSASDIETLMDNLTEENINSFIDRLSSMGHESPFEHITFTFGIEGVSRALLAQITRHRIASYSVQSQRYVDMTDFKYVTPPIIATNPEINDKYTALMDTLAIEYASLRDELIAQIIYDNYGQEIADIVFEIATEIGEDEESAKVTANDVASFWNNIDKCPDEYLPHFNFWKQTLIEKFKEKHKKLYNSISKVAQEDARFVLPNACETKIVMTMNARSLFNFFKLRCCTRAQWEIRFLATEMLLAVLELAPRIFKHAGPSCVRGKCSEGAMSCGHPFKLES